jgi:hypothetical protein
MKMNVLLDGVSDEMMHAAAIIDNAMQRYLGAEAVITSGKDGVHSRTSLHYSGNALDFRTRDMKPTMRKLMRDIIAEKLGKDYDVVLESDHLHVEYQPEV